MQFKANRWFVETLKFIENAKHVKRMVWTVIFVAVLFASASLITAVRWW